jgi:hypothetical protein
MAPPPKNLDLLECIPLHFSPDHRFVDLYTLVPKLLDLHPSWTAEDMVEFVEEKTRNAIHPEDRTNLITLYQRCVRLRREFEG